MPTSTADSEAMDAPALYLISDRKAVRRGTLAAAVAAALDAGVGMIQLREKDLPAAELLSLAEELRLLTRGYRARLLINDRVDVALACDADGVHLGGHSLPAAQARKLLGPKRLIGVSTHRLEEVRAAEAGTADFVTFGPVFDTPSKRPFGAPVGLAALAEACRSTRLPVYALGGIELTRLADVKQSGAAGVACIRAVLSASNPHTAASSLLTGWRSA